MSSWRRARAGGRLAMSASPSEEVLDGLMDAVLVLDLRERHAFVGADGLAQVDEELAGPVRALDLSVAEQVEMRQELLSQQSDALLGVALGPVVAVREMKGVDIPVVAGVVLVDQ